MSTDPGIASQPSAKSEVIQLDLLWLGGGGAWVPVEPSPAQRSQMGTPIQHGRLICLT